MFRKKLLRAQFHRFMVEHPPCVVAMEACGGAHYWAREMERLGPKSPSPKFSFMNNQLVS